MWKVLVTEEIHEDGLRVLQEAEDVELINRPGIAGEELLKAVSDADALLTRSGTAVGEELLERAPELKAVARAGVGVDNIDLVAASKRGVVVINAPTGNTLSAAEHTMAMMLSLVRKVPQAYYSVSCGRWERKRFMGCQLHGKKLLIIGLGRIGSQVASRARSFGMDVFSYDPYVQASKAERLGVTLVPDLNIALAEADIVTLHLPLTAETRGMIGEELLGRFKRGSYLVNCARGGLVDEKAVAEALKKGHLAGAAFDVFSKEPPSLDHPLLSPDLADRVVLSPHIGANTYEAQSAVSVIAAKNLLASLRGEPCEHAVNLPFAEQLMDVSKRKYLTLARKVGQLAASLFGVPQKFRFAMLGSLFSEESYGAFELPYRYAPYTVAALKGFLEVRHGSGVSYMYAPLLASDVGLSVEEVKGEAFTYKNLIGLTLEEKNERLEVLATVTEEGRQRVVCIDGFWIDFVPEGRVLLFSNYDRPGVIGKVGTLLGKNGINIANFALGRKNGSGQAVGALQVDNAVPQGLVQKLAQDADLLWAKVVDFEEDLQ
ncbi:phosphoglycerate dehydrogenase [Acetomicrobium sp. S15 = DSM 107314]|uniref:phosphoglycerate dehydrogenase n=1 Tax=Acetomicrobium sp. S15 = DSM 107314 TaxID=2529858 RepID=UPI0018E1559C|nr:phosphoglycerate dehydrogenase [Acetomicrobium sp. S15 = DSM 107314]